MPTTIGTKTKIKEIRKRAPRLDMDRLIELLHIKRDDGKYLSHQEIADKMGCSRPAVTLAIQRIPPWMLQDRNVEDYKQDRADMFAQVQQLLLQYITPDKLKSASIQQLGTLFGIMYDKERIERGQATVHVAEISSLRLDPETLKFLNKAIESRTRALLERSRKNYAEMEGSGDSDTSKVSKLQETT